VTQDVGIVSHPEINVLIPVNVDDFASVGTIYIEGVRLKKADEI
jgi:hypothetical protein